MVKVPTTAATRCVRAFIQQNEVKLSPTATYGLDEVARKVWSDMTALCFVESCHRYIYEKEDARAGQFRRTVLLSMKGTVRDYPKSALVQKLWSRLFQPAYDTAFNGRYSYISHLPEDIAWYVGALMRCIHPFETGNLILSWVVENHVRLKLGLSLTAELRPKQVFDEFREKQFLPLLSEF